MYNRVVVENILATTASETHLGEVGGNSTTFDVTLSLDAGNVYAAGEVLAATQALTNIARAAGKGMLLHSLTVVDKDDQGGAMDLVFLQTNVALGAENAAVAIADNDADEIQGYVAIAAADWKDLGGVRVAVKTGLGILLTPAAASRDLYLAAISQDAKTYTASGVTVHLGVLRD